MATFKSAMRFASGQAAVKQMTGFIRNAKIALAAGIAVLCVLFLCLLIISTYFVIQIVQSLS